MGPYNIYSINGDLNHVKMSFWSNNQTFFPARPWWGPYMVFIFTGPQKIPGAYVDRGSNSLNSLPCTHLQYRTSTSVTHWHAVPAKPHSWTVQNQKPVGELSIVHWGIQSSSSTSSTSSSSSSTSTGGQDPFDETRRDAAAAGAAGWRTLFHASPR